MKADSSPIAAIRVVEANTSLEQELAAIEDDSRLQSILEQQENDISLSNEDVDYFNEKMERHEQLREMLGLDDEEEDESAESAEKPKSGEDLWDKFDNSDLSEFE